MKLLTFSLLFFSLGLLGNDYGSYPMVKYASDSRVSVVSEDQFGNILIGGEFGVRILKGSKWEDYGNWKKPISHIEINGSGPLLVGNQDFFGTIVNDSLREVSSKISEDLNFTKVNKIISASTGNYIHLDQRILSLDEAILDYNYKDVLFAGKLNQDLIIQRKDQGLFLFAGNKFRKINGSEVLPSDELLSVLDLSNGKFLLLFQDDATIYDGDNFEPWMKEGIDWLKKLPIHSAVGSKEGIFIASGNELYQLDLQGSLFRVSDMGFPIRHLFADSRDNIWITGDHSIVQMKTSSPFRLLHALDEAGTALMKWEEELYIGTERGAYISSELSFLNGGLPLRINEEYTNAFFLDVGQCLIADRNGLDKLDGRRLENINNSEAFYEVITLEDGATLIGASSSGLSLYEKSYNRWVFKNHLYGLEEEVRQILEDEKGRLWAFSKISGIHSLNYDPVLQAINPALYQIGNLSSEEINGIFLINGKPIITSTKGLYEFNDNLNRFQESETYNRVFSGTSDVKYLYQDELENIWYLSPQESGVLKVVDRGVEKSTERIALPQLQEFINHKDPFAYSLGEGIMIFGSTDGFITLDQTKLKSKQPFLVQLYKVESEDSKNKEVNNYWVFSDRSNELLQVDKKSKTIKLKFSSTYSTPEEEVSYFYNINDTGWSQTMSNELTVKLPGGKNNVKVRAHYGFNDISNTLVVPLLIQQDWFMKEINQYFIIGGIGLLLLLLLAIMWWLLKSNKKKFRAIEHQMADFQKENRALRDKNEILSAQLISAHNENEITIQLENFQKENSDPEVAKAIKKLTKKLKASNHKVVDKVSPDPEFIARLKMKYPVLTKKDIRLCSLLKMDLTTKDIAPILDITVRGVEISRYRLRKKLELDNEVVLSEFLKEI